MTRQSVAVHGPKRRHAHQLLVRLDRAVLDVAISMLLAAIERIMRRSIAQRAAPGVPSAAAGAARPAKMARLD